MCGIFGIITDKPMPLIELRALAKHSQQRGKDSSGLFLCKEDQYSLHRSTEAITSLLKTTDVSAASFLMGHSRLITNGLSDNQPVIKGGVCVIHNGIIVNHESLWTQTSKKRAQEIDTEIIAALIEEDLEHKVPISKVHERVLRLCKGVVACAVALPRLGKLCLFSNNGSLYLGLKDNATFFSSEEFPLRNTGCKSIRQVRDGVVLSIPISQKEARIFEENNRNMNLVPKLGTHREEEKLLVYENANLRRCSRCILPETMPFIQFDDQGVCNYCKHYKIRNSPRPVEELFELVEPYRRKVGNDCIVPFSGGRDSCYGLHLIVNELKMSPVTYTYDWGMVTDLGRRNISRMCSQLGVENIIIAADIQKKRKNIAMNLNAWLRSPHLGMISILTAGDKHFFKHVETVKEQTGISLNLWGVNPLEVTHFKAGFLGVPPYFEEERVYSHGGMKQLRYQFLRLKAMLKSPGYFNSSLWDTLSGEYHRSFTRKSDYYHIFDYWRWDETQIEGVLSEYDWELAPDTRTTWRIGDGTAAFYNYIYHSVAGFTEHDTFRSNQIREGDITREDALAMVKEENRPRYPNIKWYLDAVGMDFKYAIEVINAIPKLYPR